MTENDESYENWQNLEIGVYAAQYELTHDYILDEFVIDGYFIKVNIDDFVKECEKD